MKMSTGQIIILIIIIIGGLLGTFLAAYQYWDSIKSDKEDSEKQDQIKDNLIGNKNLPSIVVSVGKSGRTNDEIEYYLIDFQISNPGVTPIRGAKAYIWDMYHAFLNESIKYPQNTNTNSPVFTGSTKPNVDPNAEQNLIIGNLPPQNGYSKFYHTELPQKVKNFHYVVKVEWDNGYAYFNLSGSNIILDNNRIPILKVENYKDYIGNTDNKCVSVVQ